MRSFTLVLLAVLFIACAPRDAAETESEGAPPPPPAASGVPAVALAGGKTVPMEIYRHQGGPLVLYKPMGWKVQVQEDAESRYISVRDPREVSRATALFFRGAGGMRDSVGFASEILRQSVAKHPDLQVLRASSTKERLRTVTDVRFTNDRGVPVSGRYYFSLGPDARVAFGYETKVEDFERMQPLLLSVLSNVMTAGTGGGAGGRQGQEEGRAPAPRPAAPTLPAMASRSLPDGTGSLLVPQGWSLQGGQGLVLCESPEGAGFNFWMQKFVGPSRIPYFDSNTIPGPRSPWRKPLDAVSAAIQLGGSRPLGIRDRAPNPGAMQTLAAMNIQGEAEVGVVSFVDPKGRRAEALVDAVSAYPSAAGEWYAMWMAVYAPEGTMDRHYPALEKVASSYRVNEQWTAGRIQAGLENLQRLRKKTAEAVARTQREVLEGGRQAYEERQRSRAFTDAKFDSYLRGEQEWISEVEGGRIYTSDSWGLHSEGETISELPEFRYHNYQGDNPHYNERMTPVDVSREVFEKVHPPGR